MPTRTSPRSTLVAHCSASGLRPRRMYSVRDKPTRRALASIAAKTSCLARKVEPVLTPSLWNLAVQLIPISFGYYD